MMAKSYWITAEITRRAFMKIEAEEKDEARAMGEQLLEEGAFEGWEEDVPEILVEEIPEDVQNVFGKTGIIRSDHS